MSIQSCRAKVNEYLKENGLDRKIKSGLVEAWSQRIHELEQQNLTKPQLGAALKDMVEGEIKRVQAAEKAANLNAQAKALDAVGSVRENTAQWKLDYAEGKRGILFKDNPEKIPVEATRAWIEGGSLRAGRDSNRSTLRDASYLQKNFRSTIDTPIQEILPQIESGKLDRGFFQELWAQDTGGTKGESGSKEAEIFAKAFKNLRDKIFQIKQSLNPYLESAQNYLMKQFHDPKRISAVPKEQWVGEAMQYAGQKSFPGLNMEQKIKTFGNVYDRIVDGTWGSAKGDEDFITYAPKGTGDILQSMAKSREIIFNDWQSHYEYNSKYGYKTVYEGINKLINRSARDISTMDKFSSKPQKMFSYVVDQIADSLEGKEKEIFNQSRDSLQRSFNVAMQKGDMPANSTVATVGKVARVQQYLAKVGGIFHAAQDGVMALSMAKGMHGDSILSRAFDFTHDYLHGLISNGWARDSMSKMKFFTDALHSETLDAMGAPGDKPGMVTQGVEWLSNLNLYQRHIESVQNATVRLMTNLLADHADFTHGELSPHMKQGLLRYGIDAPEWEAMRGAASKLGEYNVLLPENVERISDGAAEKYLRDSGQYVKDSLPARKTLDMAKFELARRLGGMLTDHAETASAQLDNRQKTFLWGDTTVNSGMGQLRRMVTQFHAAAIINADAYRRAYFSGTAPGGNYWALAQHAALALFVAGMSDYAKQIIEGKTPQSPLDAKFAGRIAINSGFSGMYGDALINAMNRTGYVDKSLALSTGLAGPVLGTGIEAGGLGLQAITQILGGEKPDRSVGINSMSLLHDNLPWQNLWATKALMNYWFWNGAKESVDSGFIHRLTQRTQRTPGLLSEQQSYWYAKPEGSGLLGMGE